MANCKVHNVRFYNPKVEAVYCMALHSSRKKLAISRANASVEIWNISHSPFIERTIASTPENNSIEGLAWCANRLFSVGLHDLLVEYDLEGLTKKQSLTITGGGAFCLDINKANNQIAIGTDQGYMNIFSVNDDDVLFNKFLDKQEGRILCVKYDRSGRFIASGSIDAVRLWDVESGHALHKMSTGRSEARKPTVVWCLSVLSDLTVISGDSRGKITFWDGHQGAQIESYQSHRADILALCVAYDEKSLYCAGADPLIVNYVKVNVKEGMQKWVKSIQRKVHDHDVRALALQGKKLYSCGVDGYLAVSYHPPKTLIKHPPVLQGPCVTVCAQSRLILLRYASHVEVWSLGRSKSDEGDVETLLPLETEPKNLLTLHRGETSESGNSSQEGLICASMSSNGKWIIFGTDAALRIFNFTYSPGEKVRVKPINDLPEEWDISLRAVFTPDNSQLILAPRSGGIQVYNLDENEKSITFKQHINTNSMFTGAISFLITSPCGNYILAADTESHIVVWNLFENKWEHYCKLPHYTVPATAISINARSRFVVAAYADHKVVEYDLAKKKFTKFSRNLDNNGRMKWSNRLFPIRNIVHDPSSKNIHIMHDDSSIIVINKTKPLPESNCKIPKIESTSMSDSNDSFKSNQFAFHAIKKYKHLVHLEWLSEDELVAVEVSPLSISTQLPPCLKQNLFGRK